MTNQIYLRFIDASGHIVSLDGGSLFAADGVNFSEDSGSTTLFGELNFNLGSSSLSSLLDQELVDGSKIAAVEVFQTTSLGGSTQVVAEDVFKDVGIAGDGINAGTGAHSFTAVYDGLVESAPGVSSNGGSTTNVVDGWNQLKNISDNRLNTDINGKVFNNTPEFSKDVAATSTTSQPLDYYVRLSDAKGNNLLGSSLTGTAGWVQLNEADLGFSQVVSFSTGGDGKAAFNPVQLMLDGSSLDPVLLQALASRAGLQMEIAAYAPADGTSSTHLVSDYRFGSVTATSASTQLGAQATNQTYDLSYKQEVIEQYATNVAGTTTLSSSEGWNESTNAALSTTSTLVPTQNAPTSTPLVPIAGSLPTENTYMRFIDASGKIVSLSGESLFEAGGVNFSQESGVSSLYDLNFNLSSSNLSSLLDQTLVSGQNIAAIDVFQTTSLGGSTQVVAENVFKDVDLTSEDIDAGTGAHSFAAVSRDLVEETAVVDSSGTLIKSMPLGWNQIQKIADDSLDTDVNGRFIGNTSDLPINVAAASDASQFINLQGTAAAATSSTIQPLDYYVRLSDAKGHNLLGSSLTETAGWLQLNGADLGFSRVVSFGSGGDEKVAFNPVTLMLDGSSLDPVLLQALGSQAGLQMEIATYAPADGISPTHLVSDYRFGSVTATSASTQLGTQVTNQTYDLSYKQEVIEQYATNAAGITKLSSSEGWNESTNAALSTASTLVPTQNAPTSAPPVPIAESFPAENTYMRFIDTSGQAVSLDGGSIYKVNGVSFSGQGANKTSFGELSFNLGSSSLSSLLDQKLVSGSKITAVEVFQTTSLGGSTQVVAEDVFKDVGLTGNSINASTGEHSFNAVYGGLVESTPALNSSRGLIKNAIGGWNQLRNVSDNSLNTDINGKVFNNTPDFSKDVAATSTTSQPLDYYVRLSDAKGNNLLGSSLTGTAGWLQLNEADLGFSQVVFLETGEDGKVAFNPVQLMLDGSSLDPVLLQALASRAGLQMEIAAYAPADGISPTHLVSDYRFGSVTATSASTQLGAQATNQTYDLSYKQEVIEQYATNVAGTTTLSSSEGWNESTNAALSTTSTLVPTQNAQLQTLPTLTAKTLSTPSFGGAPVDVSIGSGAATHPFAETTLSDPGTGALETLTITAPLTGTFSGTGFTLVSGHTYVANGTVAQINADLAGATFSDTFVTSGDLPSRPDYVTLRDIGSVAGTASVNTAFLAGVINVQAQSAAPCFATGTLIRTAAGDVAVDELRVGDQVCTASGGLQPVRWLGHRRVDCRRHPTPEQVRPVRVRAHSFGEGLPARDLVLSPEHALFLDGHLVPVHALVDGVSVVQEAWERVTYHHVELDRHDVLLAEGLAAESYLDTGNRAQFANAPLVDMHPAVGAGRMAVQACAPLLLAGPRLEALRRALQDVRISRIAADGVDPGMRRAKSANAHMLAVG
ncbi:MAG: Hint domain-containing protein [Janthinobacterium lividum]